jgi:hypothetical protein
MSVGLLSRDGTLPITISARSSGLGRGFSLLLIDELRHIAGSGHWRYQALTRHKSPSHLETHREPPCSSPARELDRSAARNSFAGLMSGRRASALRQAI